MIYKQVQSQQLRALDQPPQWLTYIYLLQVLLVEYIDHTTSRSLPYSLQ